MAGDSVCDVDFFDFKHSISNKKAIDASLFIIFIVYTIVVAIAEFKKGSGVGTNMKRFVNEVAYQQIFFFLAIIAAHYIIPKPFPVILLYIYMTSFFLQLIAYVTQKKILHMIVSVIQFVLVFILFILIMSMKWCNYFLFRGY